MSSRLSRAFALAGAVPLIAIALLSAGSETRIGTMTRLMLIQGIAVYAGILALRGAFRRNPRLILLSSLVMFAMTALLIVGTSGLITLVCAVCFLISYLAAIPGARQQSAPS